MPQSPAARRAAALRHPDALGVAALNRWAAPPAAPAPLPTTMRPSFAAALAQPVGEAALGAAWDARRAKGAAPRARWSEDAGPVFGGWTERTLADAMRGVR